MAVLRAYPDSDWEHDGVFTNHHNRPWIKTLATWKMQQVGVRKMKN